LLNGTNSNDHIYNQEMLSYTDNKIVEEMPVTPATLKERYLIDNYPVYRDFCSFFVSGVVGIRHFDRSKCLKRFSKYVSISDEAFTVLTLENNWERWSSMAFHDDWKESNVPSRWTTSKEKRAVKKAAIGNESSEDDEKPQARKFRGWSAQGIARYNQLFAEIKQERENDTYKDFENYCLEEFEREAEEQGRGKYKRRKVDNDKPLPSAKHELWEDEAQREEVDAEITRKVPSAFSGLIGYPV
jgi:hypothetical protein